MDRDPADVVAHELDLTGVDARTDLESETWHRARDRQGAADRPCRPVECGKESVAGGIDLATAIPSEFLTDQGVVPLEQVLPCPVSDGACPFRRCDDVGEEDGGKDTIPLRRRPDARQEFLDLIKDGISVAEIWQVVDAVELD